MAVRRIRREFLYRSDSRGTGTGLLRVYASRRSAALLLFPTPHHVEVGSSTAVEVAGRYFLATAGHNIEDLEDDAQIRVVISGGPVESVPLVRRNSRRFHGAATVDVAWIELEPQAARRSRLEFLHLSELSCRERDDSKASYFVQGYPSEMVRGGGPEVEPLSIGFVTRSIDPVARGPRHQSGIDFAVEYTSYDGWNSLPRAPGMSGGGIWCLERGAPGSVELVAITRAWYSGRRELCGTSIVHWLELLAADLPELRQHLEPVWGQGSGDLQTLR